MPTYTRTNLYDDIRNDASTVKNIDRIVNRAVRYVIGDLDLRSTKRKAYISPYLNEEQFDYQSPSDLKEWAVIDIRQLANRKLYDKFAIVSNEYFDRYKDLNPNIIAIQDDSFLQKLRISADLEEEGSQVTLHNMDDDNPTGGGTWAVGGSGSNLTVDSDNFIEGEASLNFDGAASYTSILLTNSTFTAIDISDYETGGAVFVYVYIPSTTGLTSFKLRVGSDASNYFERIQTVTNENLAFQTGWNLLRFEFNAATKTGTVDMDNIDYLRLEIVGDGTAGATTDWRVDYIVARRGIPHEIWYYTKFGWQTSAGAYIENSTAATDKINCDTEEYELFILKGKELVAEALKNFDDMKIYHDLYENKKENYLTKYPSERLISLQTYYNFGSDYNNEMSW